jgi:trk system potassium uptake protein TrkH
MADYTLVFTMLLMFVGGASGSTAGGVKVNTVGLIAATVWSSIKGREHAMAYEREFTNEQISRALTVVVLAAVLVSLVVFALTITEEFTFLRLSFETISAFGTVGLSTGVTPSMTLAGKLIIIFMMFVGRVGPLTLTLALVRRQRQAKFRYPEGTVRIG